jgi:folate-binding protein YgfZ
MTPSAKFGCGEFFDLSFRVKLRITGLDAVRFLNGQITNDLRKASATSAIQASILNAKGKLNGHVFVSGDADGFFLDADSELRAELPERLDRYVVADDVEIEDVTDRFSILHVIGATPPSTLDSVRSVHSNRFGRPGWDIWVHPPDKEAIRRRLGESFLFCDEACAETLRVEQGIPRWGRELTDQIIPVEAALEASSIDYSKGCYIGQEVISRMKMSGQSNKRLRGLVSVTGAPMSAGMRLLAEKAEAQEAGWLTSAVWSERLAKQIALGYVKRGFNSPGSRLRAVLAENSVATGGIPVEVVSLPFI